MRRSRQSAGASDGPSREPVTPARSLTPATLPGTRAEAPPPPADTSASDLEVGRTAALLASLGRVQLTLDLLERRLARLGETVDDLAENQAALIEAQTVVAEALAGLTLVELEEGAGEAEDRSGADGDATDITGPDDTGPDITGLSVTEPDHTDASDATDADATDGEVDAAASGDTLSVADANASADAEVATNGGAHPEHGDEGSGATAADGSTREGAIAGADRPTG